ncbi:hypothetical protein FC46_GL001324 [Lactobacillus kalixensis DSM 16043]|uniref:Uncharacterized protein n=2 Tax=Lactobacillus kalixensis TaxID=227944 RepID=A0A0R1UC83_9LACO|nr:hypothetical protein FC46_GL001324 [Lactobacillus kalixensis DSM 16043]
MLVRQDPPWVLFYFSSKIDTIKVNKKIQLERIIKFMKKYRPSNKQVMIGIILMVLGILCWCIVATVKNNPNFMFLFPVGLVLLCLGGLELTIIAIITTHKNDLAMREVIKKREEKNNDKKDISNKN